MIKNERIQRYLVEETEDGMCGHTSTLIPKESVDAAVSIISTFGDITQFGVKSELVIHTVTSVSLDTRPQARYKYQGNYFKILRQIKRGPEYYSTMQQVAE